MRLLCLAACLSAATPAFADCRLELELIGIDLKGVRLTEQQKLAVAPLIDEGLKRCRLGRETAATVYFDKARKVAGIERRDDDDLPAPTVR
jgi:hypothetical protein